MFRRIFIIHYYLVPRGLIKICLFIYGFNSWRHILHNNMLISVRSIDEGGVGDVVVKKKRYKKRQQFLRTGAFFSSLRTEYELILKYKLHCWTLPSVIPILILSALLNEKINCKITKKNGFWLEFNLTQNFKLRKYIN